MAQNKLLKATAILFFLAFLAPSSCNGGNQKTKWPTFVLIMRNLIVPPPPNTILSVHCKTSSEDCGEKSLATNATFTLKTYHTVGFFNCTFGWDGKSKLVSVSDHPAVSGVFRDWRAQRDGFFALQPDKVSGHLGWVKVGDW